MQNIWLKMRNIMSAKAGLIATISPAFTARFLYFVAAAAPPQQNIKELRQTVQSGL